MIGLGVIMYGFADALILGLNIERALYLTLGYNSKGTAIYKSFYHTIKGEVISL